MSDLPDDALKDVPRLIVNSKYLIALTGAGISKESDVPTFRGEDGLWHEYDAMNLATPQAFQRNPNLVWEWYSWRQSLIADCSPNAAHKILAKWEQMSLLKAIITQNVDGLHYRAGSRRVMKVHGDLWATRCTSCDYSGRLSRPAEGIPSCPQCGSSLRPDVVWFGESLDPSVMSDVYSELGRADTCLVIGTSALVQPAASFPLMIKRNGGAVVEINIETTPLTQHADYHLSGKAGEVLPEIDEHLQSYID